MIITRYFVEAPSRAYSRKYRACQPRSAMYGGYSLVDCPAGKVVQLFTSPVRQGYESEGSAFLGGCNALKQPNANYAAFQ
jgi:hypothetical protein